MGVPVVPPVEVDQRNVVDVGVIPRCGNADTLCRAREVNGVIGRPESEGRPEFAAARAVVRFVHDKRVKLAQLELPTLVRD